MKDTTCCFTGHRPDKLYGYNIYAPKYKALFNRIEEIVRELIEEHGVKKFIVGGALGFDSIAFLVVYGLKKQYDIEIEIAVPFKQQHIKWFKENVEFYLTSLELADNVVEVDKLDDYRLSGIKEEVYHPAKMQKRNEYMVNNSKYVIACWNGTKGGTGNTVNYVRSLGNRNCIIVEP